jgi:hypothetical protein
MNKVQKTRALTVIPIFSVIGYFLVGFFIQNVTISNIANIVLGISGLFSMALCFLSFYWGWKLKGITQEGMHLYLSIGLFLLAPFIMPFLFYMIMAVVGLDAKARLIEKNTKHKTATSEEIKKATK